MRYLVTLVILLAAFLVPSRARALPVFAHRFGLSCQACHTTVPHLNAFGQAFASSGFRLPKLRRNAIVPVAMKVNLAYSSDADPTGLPKAIVDEVEILTGGAIGNRFNYFLEQYAIDGGRAGRPRDMWVQYNNANAHVRAGEFTLPLPVDPETERDTEAHYLLYDQTVGANTFNFFDSRIGVEAYSSNGNGDGVHLAAFAKGGAMAYAAKSFGGLSLYAYRYEQGFFRQGFGAREHVGKFDVVGVLQNGRDASVASSGGFLEGHYSFSPSLMAVARYDRVWDALSGSQQQTVLSLVTRPARNMRFTIEDQMTDHHTLNLGWLFAY